MPLNIRRSDLREASERSRRVFLREIARESFRARNIGKSKSPNSGKSIFIRLFGTACSVFPSRRARDALNHDSGRFHGKLSKFIAAIDLPTTSAARRMVAINKSAL